MRLQRFPNAPPWRDRAQRAALDQGRSPSWAPSRARPCDMMPPRGRGLCACAGDESAIPIGSTAEARVAPVDEEGAPASSAISRTWPSRGATRRPRRPRSSSACARAARAAVILPRWRPARPRTTLKACPTGSPTRRVRGWPPWRATCRDGIAGLQHASHGLVRAIPSAAARWRSRRRELLHAIDRSCRHIHELASP